MLQFHLTLHISTIIHFLLRLFKCLKKKHASMFVTRCDYRKYRTLISAIGFPLCFVALLLNLLAFVYFTTRKKKFLPTILLIFLCSFDVLICLTYVPRITGSPEPKSLKDVIEHMILRTCIAGSTSVTAALSVIRFIAIVFPFHRIRRRHLWILMCILTITYSGLLNYAAFMSHPYVFMSILLLFLGCSLASLFTGIWSCIQLRLHIARLTRLVGDSALVRNSRLREAKQRKYASHTILLLLIAFTATNIGTYVSWYSVEILDLQHDQKNCNTMYFLWYVVMTSILFNPLLNGFIHVTRRSEFRHFIRQKLQVLQLNVMFHDCRKWF